ncbi:MAG: methyltransferase [Myxococcota bacterium]
MSSTLPMPGGSDESIALVRGALDEHGYFADRIRTRLGLGSPRPEDAVNGDLRSRWRQQWFASARAHAETEDPDALDVLIRLFEVGEPIALGQARQTLGARVVEQTVACGLVALGDGVVRPRFLVSCVGPIRVVTDTDEVANDRAAIDGSANPLVMPVYVETQLFAAAVDRDPAARGLDLCTGSGVHALLLASHCAEVVATDVSPRAVEVARFNTRLNAIDNVTVIQGPIWAPLEGRRFDIITANPPYQPDLDDAPGSNWWGAQGRGEGVWRPIVEQLHQHLEGDGRCFIILQGLSWTDDPFVPRVRRYAPTLDVHFERFGSPELSDYRSRYQGHGMLAEALRAADYGVLRLQHAAATDAREVS